MCNFVDSYEKMIPRNYPLPEDFTQIPKTAKIDKRYLLQIIILGIHFYNLWGVLVYFCLFDLNLDCKVWTFVPTRSNQSKVRDPPRNVNVIFHLSMLDSWMGVKFGSHLHPRYPTCCSWGKPQQLYSCFLRPDPWFVCCMEGMKNYPP